MAHIYFYASLARYLFTIILNYLHLFAAKQRMWRADLKSVHQ